MKWILVIPVFLFFSCSKKNYCGACDGNCSFVNATIIDSGPVATDGCGWVIRIGADQYYHPESLKEEFRKNELQVQICYVNTTAQFHCGIAGSPMPVIRLLAVRKL